MPKKEDPDSYKPTPKVSREEYKFISISVGNTNLRWALQDTRDDNLEAQYLWTTPHIQHQVLLEACENDDNSGLSELFVRFLPEDAKMLFYGGGPKSDGSESQDKAIQQRDLRGYDVSVYLVSSNPTQTEFVKKLVSCTPSKVHVMQPDDFFSVEEGRYPGMGIDRLAALRGAMAKCGVPAMVFDGGTSFTYAAVDQNGHIMGGGITAGLQMRLDALSHNCENLPSLDINVEAIEEFEKLKKSPSSKVSCFARSTRDAIIHGMMFELYSSMKEIIRQWINQSTKEGSQNSKKGKKRGNVTALLNQYSLNQFHSVFFTGGSGELLERLVRPGYELVEGSSNNLCSKNFYYETTYVHDLIHIGVSWYIRSGASINDAKQKNQDPTVLFNPQQYVNKRVAGFFSGFQDQIFRGTVSSYTICDDRKEPIYLITYDDGDQEEMYYQDNNAIEGRDLKTLLSVFDKYGEEEPDPMTEPLLFINRRFAKKFFGCIHFGSIASYDITTKYWKVIYDDSDSDENDKDELLEGLKLYNEVKPQDPKF